MRAPLLFALSLVACGRFTSEPAPAPAPPPPIPGRWEGLPGWLGVVGTGDGRASDAFPTLAASVHDVGPTDSWAFAKPGDRFHLVDTSGASSGTFLGHQPIPLGCDDTMTSLAAFSSDRPLTGEAVWVVPGTGPSPLPEPITLGKVSSDRRSYDVPGVHGLYMYLKQTGPLSGRLVVKTNNVTDPHSDVIMEVIHIDEPYEKSQMDGGSEDPIDLTDDNAIGVPYPVAAFRFDTGQVVIVFRRQSWEGFTLDAWKVRPRTEHLGWVGVYLCAF